MGFFEVLIARLQAQFPELKDKDLSSLENDAEIKAAFDEDTTTAIDDAVKALQTKNTELIKEKRKLQERIKAGGGEDPEAYETKISELNEQVTMLTGQVTAKDREINKLTTKYKADTEKLGTDLKSERDRNTRSLLDAAVAESIGKLELTDKALTPLVKSYFERAFSVVEEGGERKVVAKYLDDTKKEVQLNAADYADVWSKTPEGQAVIKVKAAGGAGETGARGSQKGQGSEKQGSSTEGNPFAELKFDEQH